MPSSLPDTVERNRRALAGALIVGPITPTRLDPHDPHSRTIRLPVLGPGQAPATFDSIVDVGQITLLHTPSSHRPSSAASLRLRGLPKGGEDSAEKPPRSVAAATARAIGSAEAAAVTARAAPAVTARASAAGSGAASASASPCKPSPLAVPSHEQPQAKPAPASSASSGGSGGRAQQGAPPRPTAISLGRLSGAAAAQASPPKASPKHSGMDAMAPSTQRDARPAARAAAADSSGARTHRPAPSASLLAPTKSSVRRSSVSHQTAVNNHLS